VYRPPVHANTERDIGFKRSSDGWAHTPRQDSNSGNSALLIGSGSYECPALQRFRTCIACLACLVSFSFRLQICQLPRNLSSVPPASSRDTTTRLTAHTGRTNFSVSGSPALHGFSGQHSALRIPCSFIHAWSASLRPVASVTCLRLLWMLRHPDKLQRACAHS
jgi:hypothetical protein